MRTVAFYFIFPFIFNYIYIFNLNFRMNIREIFRKLWITAAIFQHPPYFSCLLLSLSLHFRYRHRYCLIIIYSIHPFIIYHSEPEGWGSPRGYRPTHSRSGPIDFTRAILSDYFIYSAARSGAVSYLGILDRGFTSRGQRGREWAHRGGP